MERLELDVSSNAERHRSFPAGTGFDHLQIRPDLKPWRDVEIVENLKPLFIAKRQWRNDCILQLIAERAVVVANSPGVIWSVGNNQPLAAHAGMGRPVQSCRVSIRNAKLAKDADIFVSSSKLFGERSLVSDRWRCVPVRMWVRHATISDKLKSSHWYVCKKPVWTTTLGKPLRCKFCLACFKN